MFAELLARRVRRDGARPLLTSYPGGGQRTELSAISYANWVAKTANLLEELDVGPGDAVALPVLRDHPASWMSLAWVGACWTAGCVATPGGDDAAAAKARAVVTGPEIGAATDGQTAIACSLHPMGLGFVDELPAGTIDWVAEARIQPDAYAGTFPSPDDVAWVDSAQQLSQAQLGAIEPSSARSLVIAADPWPTVRDALLAPLLGGGSAVVVGAGIESAERARIAASERVG